MNFCLVLVSQLVNVSPIQAFRPYSLPRLVPKVRPWKNYHLEESLDWVVVFQDARLDIEPNQSSMISSHKAGLRLDHC